MNDYTLNELINLKKDWIQTAVVRKHFDDLLILVSEMGTEFQKELPYGWNREKALRLKVDNLTIEAYHRDGKYLPAIGDYEKIILVRVQMLIEGRQYVIATHIHTDQKKKTDEQRAQSLFIPGEWWGSLQHLIDQTKGQLKNRNQAIEHRGRLKLAEELLIGKDI